MIRRIREHVKRHVTDLDGIWDFAFLGDVDPESVDPRSIEFVDAVAVPGSFDAAPAYAGRRGLVAYRKHILLTDATRHRVTLNGVHHWCRGFLIQGRTSYELGDHSGGFTVFHLDVTGHSSGGAFLIVLVDNRFDTDRCPTHLDYFDWYHYGGITRGAELTRLGEAWIESLRVDTVDYRRRTLKVTVSCGADVPVEEMLTVEIDGTEMASMPITLERGVVSVEREVDYRDGGLWSPEHPVLHTIRVTLGADDLIDRFGIREVTVDGPQILINGKPTRLLGFCRHEAHPQFGCGLPAALQIEDLQLLKDLGANFVRGSHYPQDPRFLDLCDEQGICVWSEATGWQHTAEHFSNPRFIEAQLENIHEMIDSAANRPSVIMWGLQNESHSEDESNREAYETLIGEIRRLDASRPVTYASNRWPNDRFHDLIDIISFNTYPGWYVGGMDGIPDVLNGIIEAIDGSSSAGKPVIVSEIGAGAVPGWVDRNEGRWSEQYQAALLERVIDHLFVDTDRVCGLAIWQFCDCRTAELVSRTLGRPRGFNNKGILDEYRRPKRAYDAVKRRFGSL